MYENQTENVILNRMMNNTPTEVDKREGSIMYDASKPTAIELMLMYAALDFFLKNTFGDTADREYLVERALERGLTPERATYAKVKAVCTPETVEVPIGTELSYDDLNYTVVEKESAGVYLLVCDTPGTIGNKSEGKLIPNDYVRGLETATLIEVVVPGEDEEDTEVFRARYLASFDSMAFGGNIADYKTKVNKIPGVGGCKVYPIWQGGGTVRVVFMTTEYKPPSAEFVEEVQTLVDPVTNHAQGIGTAPIGHTVTVQGVQNSAVRVGLHLSVTGSLDDYKDRVLEIIDKYFLELNENWADTKTDRIDNYSNSGIVIRISQIESRILAIEGVEDIEHTSLDGVEENLTLGVDELAVRGDVVWV